MAGGRSVKIGIALDDRSAVAVIVGRRGAPAARVAGAFGDDGPGLGSELRRAFQELKASLEAKGSGPTAGSKVSVALLPPLSDARLIPFPPMRKEEAEAVVSRDAARYFLGAQGPLVIGVRTPGQNQAGARRAEGATTPIIAAAAGLPLLERIRDALVEVGWRGGTLAAAHGAWLSAATGGAEEADGLVVLTGSTLQVARLRNGDPEGARQIPLDDPAALTAALGPGAGRVLVLAPPPVFQTIQSTLRGGGWSVLPDPDGWTDPAEGTAARAGLGGLDLVPPSQKEEEGRKSRRTALGMAAGALALLLASAGAHFLGAHRELDALRERRMEIRDEVGPLLTAWDSLNALNTRIRDLQEIEETRPIWTRTLVELSALLPRDTYLTALFASGDTVEIEAAGTRAGEAIQLLRESGLFQDLRLQGIVERELDQGETVEERFSVRGTIPPPRPGGQS